MQGRLVLDHAEATLSAAVDGDGLLVGLRWEYVLPTGELTPADRLVALGIVLGTGTQLNPSLPDLGPRLMLALDPDSALAGTSHDEEVTYEGVRYRLTSDGSVLVLEVDRSDG